MEYKTCEQYVLAELDLAKKLIENIERTIQQKNMSSKDKITVIAELLSLHK